MSKITKTTFKSFIKKNEGKLLIQTKSAFDSMSDGIRFIPCNQRKFVEMKKDKPSETSYQYGAERGITREEIDSRCAENKNTLGFCGIWVVNDSRDSFDAYEDDKFKGIEVYNSCGNFIVATPK